jgi:hypothetical protein
VRITFDENTPRVVAHAIKLIAEAEAAGDGLALEVLHALDVVAAGTKDVPLVQAVVEGIAGPAALVTTDKAMRTRQHERAAFRETGCIGIVLRGDWNRASMWNRARLSLMWFPIWRETIVTADPGTLWQCPWSSKPKRLSSF